VLPLWDDNPTRRRPYVTWALIIACVVAYFFWQPTPFANTTEDTRFTIAHAAIPCEVVQGRPLSVEQLQATFQGGDTNACGVGSAASPALDPGKNVYLAVITSMFLHGGLLHLGGNMLFLWVFGNNVEDKLGHLAYLAFYLVGGLVAAAAQVTVNLNSTVPVIGASGAIAAVMGAYLIWFPRVRVHTLVFFLIIRLPARLVLVAWFVLQFFTDPNEGVAWVAHVGGFIFGAAIALAVAGASRAGGGPPPAPRPYYDGRY